MPPKRNHSTHLSTLFVAAFMLATLAATAHAEHVKDEVLVVYHSFATEGEIQALEQTVGLIELSRTPHLFLRHYRIPGNLTVESAIESIEEFDFVEFAEPNFIAHPNADPYFSLQWGLDNDGDIDIDWPEAMAIYRPQGDVVVAVIDTGVAYRHPDLDDSMWSRIGTDFVDSDNDPMDEDGHGTFIASVIAAERNNGIGAVGVAPNAKIMALRVGTGDGLDGAAIIEASTYAANNGARIINASFGSTDFSFTAKRQIEWLDSQGVLVVAAAMNDAADAPAYPASYAVPNIISVGAIEQTGERWSSSNYGPTVDIGAPGDNMIGATIDGDYRYGSGTSFAAPVVVGVAALLMSQQPSLTHHEVRDIILATAVPGPDFNVVNAHAALQDIAESWTYTPLLNPASNTNQESHLRIVNKSITSTDITIIGTDDAGNIGGGVYATLAPLASLELTARELELGSAKTTGGFGNGAGKWQAWVKSGGAVQVLSFIQTPVGYVSSMNNVVPRAGAQFEILFANPASNTNQQSFLRFANPTDETVSVTLTGIDDAGKSARGEVRFTLGPWAAKQINSGDYEFGNTSKGLSGALGSGSGKWRIVATSSSTSLRVMSLVRTPDGFLTNLSRPSSAW